MLKNIFFLLSSITLGAAPALAQSQLLLVGTYSKRGSEGIYTYRLDSKTGALAFVSVAKGIENPSFLAIAPGRRFVYAVAENDKGSVAAYRFDAKTGQLTPLNTQSSEGVWPCHLEVDQTGKWCIAGNYGSGNLCLLPIGADGSLGKAVQVIQHEGKGPNAQRQEKAHVHSVNIAANNRDVFVADLGIDQIVSYQLDAVKGKLEKGNPPFVAATPGAGPRHFAYHPKKRYAYAILELNSTIAVYRYKDGTLSPSQVVSTLPLGYEGPNSCADLHVSPDGLFLYGSNRGHDSIVIYKIDPATGHLTLVGHEPTRGKTPRNFAIDPTGKFLLVANQESDNIQVFKRNPKNGKLRHTKHSAQVSMPVCLKF